ncbi:MAG: diguanylate cyclase [Nitrospira sp.]|nr:diguanylate cyclase [Nitrospira sp.]
MFKHIGYKIILVFGSVLIVVMLILGFFFTVHQERSILAQNKRNMAKLTQSVAEGLQTIMIAGYADVAETFADRLHNVPDVIGFDILRTNGLEAFKDNITIDDVNRRIGSEEFLPRDEVSELRLLDEHDPNLMRALETGEMVSFYREVTPGVRNLSFIAPIMLSEQCYSCHGRSQPVKGILLLVTSLAQAEEDISSTRKQATQIAILSLIVIVLVTGAVIRRSVSRPIKSLTEAMEEVADGKMNRQVEIPSRDELGRMAGSFNMMSGRLADSYEGLISEQDKLTTIIQSTNEGIVVTDRSDKIVLINAAAEALLGKEAEQIRKDGFAMLFDDPGIIESHLQNMDNDTEGSALVHYQNRIFSLSASRILSKDGTLIGSAALIRDVTEETRLTNELLLLSTTDGLTGLYNRRYLNESLGKELGRARRYTLDFSIIMFDVDHFKKFNDVYGHETGDRVLKMLGNVMIKTFRDIDICCRYGGEEFLIILPSTNLENAKISAERLRVAVETTSIDDLSVTISIGIASYPETDTRSIDEFIKKADLALYKAKEGGRNRVCT